MRFTYNKEHWDWIESNYKSFFYDELTQKFNEHFRLNINQKSLASLIQNMNKRHGYNIKSGRRGKIRVGANFPLEVRQLIDSLHSEFSNSELCDLIEAETGIKYKTKQLVRYRHNKGYPEYRIWTDEAIKVLMDNYQTMDYTELAELISATCNRHMTRKTVSAFISYSKLPNLDKKKSHNGGNFRKVGYVRTRHSHRRDGDLGYLEIKVAEPNEWKSLAQFNWEKVNGPVPKDYSVVHLDGNPFNCAIENLKVMPRKYLARANNFGRTNNPELKEVHINLAGLIVESNIKRRELDV